MRKVLPYLGASLSLLAMTWATTVKAQDAKPFEDVKPDHWAYQAVTFLQGKGILQGYPDGHFNGQRTLTRYEFAVALKRALDTIGTAGKGEKGDTGDRGPAGGDGAPGPKGDAGPPGMTPEEVDNLRRLTNDFKAELASLGANMKDVQAKLDRLAAEVAAINKRLDKMVMFSGDFFFGSHSSQNRAGYLDYSSGVNILPQGSVFSNISTPSDFHLHAKANLPGGVKFHGDLVSSNYITRGGNSFTGAGSLASTFGGTTAPGNTGLAQVNTLYEANLVIPIGQFGTNTEMTVGRYKHQVTPLTMYRPDNDAYFDLPWYDDGNFVQDGLKISSKFGSATTSIFGGSYSSVVGAAGPLNSPQVGSSLRMAHPIPLAAAGVGGLAFGGGQSQVTAGQVIGFHGAIPLGNLGEIGATILDFSATASGVTGTGAGAFPAALNIPGTNIGNVVVMGGNIKLRPFGRLNISGEVAKTVTQRLFSNGDGRKNDDNNAYTVNLGYNSGPIVASAGYQYIDPRYSAPGFWNKVGSWYNPTNVQGPFARVAYNFSDTLQGNIGGDWLSGARNRPGRDGFTQGSSLIRALAGIKYHANKTLSLGADYEGVLYSLSGGVSASGGRAKPVEQFLTFNAGLNVTGNTVLKFAYQLINFQDVGGGFALGGYNANVVTTQVAVHF